MRGTGIFFLILALWLFESCVQGPAQPHRQDDEMKAAADEWREHLKAGDTAVAEGRYAAAENFYQAAIRAAKRSPLVLPVSSGNPMLALTDLALALLYLNQERYADAGSLLRDSLPALGYFFGSKDPTVGVNLIGQGVVHLFSGEPEKAGPLIQRGMPILTGSDQVAARLIGTISLAVVDLNRPEPVRAQSYLEQALTILETAKDPQSLPVAANLLGLASSSLSRLETGQAQTLLKRTLAVVERVYGAEHLLVAQVLENYGLVLRLNDLAGEAELLEARAKTIRAAQPRPASP